MKTVVRSVKLCNGCHGTGEREWFEEDPSSNDRETVRKTAPCLHCDTTGRYVETVTTEITPFKERFPR